MEDSINIFNVEISTRHWHNIMYVQDTQVIENFCCTENKSYKTRQKYMKKVYRLSEFSNMFSYLAS